MISIFYKNAYVYLCILAINIHSHLMITRGFAVHLFFSLQFAPLILPGHLTLSCTLHLHTCCVFSDTLPPYFMFMHPLHTVPSDPSLQPLSKCFPLGVPECLLLLPFIYCLLLQSLSMEIRRDPPTLSQAEFPHCKQWKWQLLSFRWSADCSLR